MKRYLILLAILVIMLPAFADVIVGTGTSYLRFPFGHLYGYERSAALYPATEIGATGIITDLKWNVHSTGTQNVPIKIYLTTTTETTLTSSTWSAITAGLTPVYEGTYMFNSTGWVNFDIADFNYTGDNLLVLVETNYGGSGTSGSPNIYYSSATAMHQQWTTDSNPPAGSGSINANRPNIVLVGITQTTPPLATTPIAPMNNATLVNTSVALNWNIVNGAEGYKVYLGTNSTPPFVADVGNASTYSPAGLQPGTTYYWQIVPYNVYGEATGCPVWSFTTAPAGMVTIGTGNSNQMLPVYPYYGYNYTQSIYLQSEINMQDQRIEKIAFYWNGAGAGTNTSDWVVYMGHTDNNTFSSTSDWLPLSQLTQVYAGNLGITATAGWKEIVLTTPFVYNNTQNLVIAVDENTPSYDGSGQYFYSTLTSGQNRSLRYYNDSTNPDPASPPTGTLVAAHPNIMMQFGDLPQNPIFTYLPTSIDFGSVMNASPSLPQNVTVGNNGAGIINLRASDISLLGPNADEFSFDTSNLPAELGPGQNVTIPVIVTATTEGAISATLRMVYDGVNYDVALSATGLPAGLVMIGDGTATGTYLPINTLYGYSYSQTIYLQSEINTQDQRIEKIAYYWDAAGTGISNDQWTIYMGHADNVGFTTTTSWIPFSDLTQVYSGTVSFPATAGWMEIQLTQPFVYNNAQNLVIATLESSPSYTYGGSFLNTVAANRSIRYQSDSVLPNPASPPTGTLQGHYPNIMMFMGDLPVHPIFTYSPTSIDFGSVMNASPSLPQNVMVSNTGAGILNLQPGNISLVGLNADEFSFDAGNLPAELGPGQNVAIPVTVTATTEGPISATLRMVYDGVNYDVALSATGLPAGLVIIGDGTATSRFPLGSFYGYERSAALYTAAELGTGNKRINALGWFATQVAGDNVPTKIYLRSFANNVIESTNWDNFLMGATLVFDSTVNGVIANDWNVFAFSNTFDLFSGDNLLVLVERNYGGSGGSAGSVAPAIQSTTLANMHHIFQQDNSPPISNSTSQTIRPNLMVLSNSFELTDPPLPALAISPENGATMVPLHPTLNWISGGGGPDGYKLYFGTTNPPAFVGDMGAETSYTPANNLQGETNYYWQVVPYNTAGDATGCPVWSFVTAPAGTVILGDGNSNQYLPVNAYYGYTYSQSIYLQSEISMQDQRIEKIAYYWNGAGVGNNSNDWVVYMGHTDDSVFASTTSWIPLTQLTQVYAGTPNIPAVPGWIEIELTSPFMYNNTQNLVIAVDENRPSYDGYDQYFYNTLTTGQNRSIRYYNDSTNPDPASPPAGTLVAAYPNTRMLFGDIPVNPVFTYNPSSIEFGHVSHDIQSDPINLTVSNTGAGIINLEASNLSLLGPNANEFGFDASNLPVALGPSEFVIIPVTVTPITEGAISATLRMVYNGVNYDVELSAIGLPAGLVTIGNGVTASSYPFYSLYEAARTQTIFTVNELSEAGAFPGLINTIAYDVITANPIVLNDLMIRMKHTDSETLAAFEEGDFTTCYLANEPLQGAGWNYFDLQTSFLWNGSQNLLIDVSFTNSSWSGNSTVNATAAAGKTWARFADGMTGSTMTAGTAQANRPNTRFAFEGLVTGPPATPILVSPANGATGMPVEGFNLTWTPDLVNGGMPDYYAVFMAHDEDDIFGEEYFETTVSHFDPVAEGGLSFQNSERWFWAISAVNDEGEAVSETYRFDIVAAPPQISVTPSFFDEDLEVNDTSVQPLYIANAGGLPLEYSIRFEDQTRANRAAYSPVIHQIQPHLNAAAFAERAPFADQTTGGSRAYLDLQFIYDNADGSGEYGVASDGNYIYTSKWNGDSSQRFFRYALNGQYLGFFDIDGFSGVRDFTYDGTYFYGATNSTTVYVMDFANQSLVRTIPVPVNARGIAYDADRNGLWITNNFSGPLRLVDMNGVEMTSLAIGASSLTGLSYDAISGAGSIWANTQSGEYTNNLVQIDAETGLTISMIDVTPTLLPGLETGDLGGGIDIAVGVVPGYASIIANVQNTMMYALELCPVATWAKAEPRTGVVAPGTTETVNVLFDTEGMPAGVYEGMFTINHSAPVDPVEIPVTLTITGEWLPVFNIDETEWDFGIAELMNPIQKEFTIRNSGGPYLELTASSFSITGDTEGNFSLELLNLPVELGYNETYRLKTVFAPQSLGNKTATLNIEDGLGRALHQIPLSGYGVDEPIGEIMNLQANVENIFNVRLNWSLTSGVAGQPGWLHYDNGDNYTSIGTNQSGNFDVAIKFSSADLYGYSQYNDMQFEKVRFYPTSGNTDYTLKIWTGDDYSLAPTTLVYTQQIAAVTPNAWNEVILDTAFPIAANQAIWIGYNANVYDGESMHPAGCDNGPAVVGKGDIIYLGNWYSIKDQYGLNYNWNLQAYVNDAIAITSAGQWLNTPVANRDSGLQDISHLSLSTSGNYAPQTRVLRGFNVYRNGALVNSELIPSPTYLDTGLDTGTYTYTVQGVYYSQNTDMSDPAQVEIIIPPATPLPYAQDFEAHADNSLPEGWTRSSNGLGWIIGTDLSSQYWTIPEHTVYAAANDDTNGSGNDGSEDYLNMPALDFQIEGDGATVLLSFDSFFTGQYSQLAFVEVSTDNVDWEVVYTVPSHSTWIARSVELTQYLGNANVFIRFHSDDTGNWASGWAIDNVAVNVAFEDTFPPVITHLPLINTPITNAPYEVIAHVVDDENWNNDITLVQLAYSIDDGALVTVNMQLQGVETYVGYIPAQPLNTEISYYITAKDSENNEASTEELYFDVQNPVYMYYDMGGSAYVTFGQVYGPAVLFDNPFYGSGAPMQLLAVDGDLYYDDEVTLVIYEVTDDGFAPVYMGDVEFDGIDMCIFDLSEEDVIIEGEQFLVAYQGVPADNYFLIDRNAYYYGRSYVIVGGQLYMVSESDGAWVIGALVTNVIPEDLDAPVVTVALNDDGNPVLSWNEVPGATMYEIQISEDPYGTDWIPWDLAYVPNYTYLGDEDMMFFRVVAMDGPSITKRAIAQSEPINLRGEVFPGMRAMKANVTPRLRK